MRGVLVRGGKFGDGRREGVGTEENATGNHTDTRGRGPRDNRGRGGSGGAAGEAGVSAAPGYDAETEARPGGGPACSPSRWLCSEAGALEPRPRGHGTHIPKNASGLQRAIKAGGDGIPRPPGRGLVTGMVLPAGRRGGQTDRPGVPARSPAGIYFLKMKMQFPTENFSRHPAERRKAAGEARVGFQATGSPVSCTEPAAHTRPQLPCASNSVNCVRFFPFHSELPLAAPVR